MIDQLVEKIKKTKAPVVVGLDPMLSYIPEWILKRCHFKIWRDHGGGRRSDLGI